MKTLLSLAFAAVLCACATLPLGAQKESDAAKITALENKWNASYKARDVSAMNSLLADDFLITIEDGSTYSKTVHRALQRQEHARRHF